MMVNFIHKYLGLTAAALFGLMTLSTVSSAAVPEVKFTPISKNGAFEIRDYPSLLTAEITMPGSRDDVLEAADTLLSTYVKGNNFSDRRIGFKKPVLHKLASPLTSAITPARSPTGKFGQLWTVSYVLTEEDSLEALPRPADRRIDLIQLPPRRMAVLQFSGLWSDQNLDQHRDQLEAMLTEMGLTPVGDPIFALYDEFWQPYFWRRNEVLWEITAP